MKIGIDFGNTVARAAYLNEQGIPEIVTDFDDPAIQITPTVVHVGQRGCIVGQGVEDLLENQPSLRVARNFKNLLGSSDVCYSDEQGNSFQPVDLTALLLRKLVQDAEKAAAEAVEAVVLTVPKWFGDKEKNMVETAAEIAGIKTVQFAEESVAVVHHYGFGCSATSRNLVIYDLGSTSFSACVAETSADGINIVGTASVQRGSNELDEKIVDLARNNFRFAHGFDPAEDPIANVQLKHLATELKAALCETGVNSVRKNILLCGKPLDLFLSRRQLEKMIAELLAETVEITSQALEAAGLDFEDIDYVLMSGGNCALDLIGSYIVAVTDLNSEQIRCQQSDFAIAFGAAHLTRDLQLTDQQTRERSLKMNAHAQVLGKDLVVKSLVPGSRVVTPHVIIKKDSPLPARRELRCNTSKADQSELLFNWDLIADSDDESEAVALGKSVFGGLSGQPKGYPIDVVVTAQLDGTIEINFSDPQTGKKSSQQLEYGERREISEQEALRGRLQSLAINH